MIESLALSAALVAMLSVLAAIIYFGLVHVGINYLLHEFLVCEVTVVTQGEKHCSRDFHQRAQVFLFAAELTSFKSTKIFNKQKVRVSLKMPMNRSLNLQKELEAYR